MDIAWRIDKLVHAAVYNGVPGSTEKEYDALTWKDGRPKPTWAELLKVGDPPPNPVQYDPEKLIRVAESMGRAGDLEKLLASAEPVVRLLWQKAATFNGHDPVFKGLIAGIQEAWKLDDKQVAELLHQCEL